MFFDLRHCGSIEDDELQIRWDRTALAREAARRAGVLAAAGVRDGAIVALAHGGSAHFFADLFAIWLLGAAAAPLDSALTAYELQTLFGFLRPAVLLAGNRPPPAACDGLPTLRLADQSRAGSEPPAIDRNPDQPALVLFTSGTTGAPKAVVLSFRALQSRLALNLAAIGRGPLRRTLLALPTHFGHGLIGNALTPLLTGADLVLLPRGPALTDNLGRMIDKHAITFLSSVPSFWRLATHSAAPPLGDTLLRVHVGSAPLSSELWSQIAAWSRAEVVNCYGMTETANWVAGASSRTDFIADGFVGSSWGGKAAVRSPEGSVTTVGEGEIVIAGPSLMQGYLNRPELTAAAICGGWYRTGDCGRVDASGRIWLTGRIKDEINRGGIKIQPAEIDMLLERHPAVAEACAFALPDPIEGESVGVAVRSAAGEDIDTEALRAWCREHLRSPAVPSHWLLLDRIPQTARGKPDRNAVRQAFLATGPGALRGAPLTTGRGPATAQASRDAAITADGTLIGEAVGRAWSSVLGPRSLQANQAWANAGGDSLGALHVLVAIEKQLGVPMPIGIITPSTRPTELTTEVARAYLAAEQAGQRHSRVDLPLVFLAPPAYGDVPGLAQFREALRDRIRFHVIAYPPLRDMLAGRSGFDMLVEATVNQVLGVCGEGACLIAGYSFGGFVAREAARRLVSMGRRVAFLGLIDARLPGPAEQSQPGFAAKASAYFGRSWSQPHKLYRDGMWWMSEVLARHCPAPLLRGIDRLTMALPPSSTFAFRLDLLTRIRAHSVKTCSVMPLSVPTTLFRSEEQAGPGERGWESLCEHLVVHAVHGGHRSLFEPQYRDSLCAQFVQAVDAARRMGGSAPSCASPSCLPSAAPPTPPH